MIKKNKKNLNERQKKILFCLVKEYIKTHRPVSSSRLLEVSNIGYSSATIRNDMRKLDYFGYLKQPHMSAGRIPTDKALRFYLNAIEEIIKSSKELGNQIELDFQEYFEGDFNKILEGAIKLLSLSSNGIVIIEKPKMESLKILSIRLNKIDDFRTVVFISTELGLNETFTIFHPNDLSFVELENLLNNNLRNMTIKDVKKYVSEFQINPQMWYDKKLEELIRFLKKLVSERFEEGFLKYGFQRIVLHDLIDLGDIRNIIGFVENDRMIQEFLEREFPLEIAEDRRILIGSENGIKNLESFSLFLSNYKILDRKIGRLLLITSKIADYQKIIQLIDYVSNRLTEILTRLAKRRG
ncbi:MAG TPA: heat-inducible transcription repressor HrcA [Thermotogaceae bacterium]|nr:heat-inducible transcription repressor HrcA [Thermotogota bacterium]HEW92953.1 heat-inducible transcription repressor HrcA [Thermotogaceae bacterium]